MAHPNDDKLTKTIVFQDVVLEVKTKLPMFKFMKVLHKNPIEALELIFTEESVEKLENIDMDFADLEELLELVSNELGAKSTKN